MAFKIYSTDDGRVPGIEYLPAGAIAPKVGTALTISGGNLAIATGTTKPKYISMCEAAATLTAGTEIPVIRVGEDMVFEAPLSVAGTSLKVGDKVTIATGGEQLTATTTDGVAEIVGIVGTAAGEHIRVRFA